MFQSQKYDSVPDVSSVQKGSIGILYSKWFSRKWNGTLDRSVFSEHYFNTSAILNIRNERALLQYTPQAEANQVVQSNTFSLANPYLITNVIRDGTPSARKRVTMDNISPLPKPSVYYKHRKQMGA
jgi:hypothetical protein